MPYGAKYLDEADLDGVRSKVLEVNKTTKAARPLVAFVVFSKKG